MERPWDGCPASHRDSPEARRPAMSQDTLWGSPGPQEPQTEPERGLVERLATEGMHVVGVHLPKEADGSVFFSACTPQVGEIARASGFPYVEPALAHRRKRARGGKHKLAAD